LTGWGNDPGKFGVAFWFTSLGCHQSEWQLTVCWRGIFQVSLSARCVSSHEHVYVCQLSAEF